MYVTDLKTEFYERLKGKRILILTVASVDAACACTILTNLFKLDGFSFTLACVEGKEELSNTFQQHRDQIDAVLMVNCGGTVDIVYACEAPQNITFYILDSHRPTHIMNVYEEFGQVRLLMPALEYEKVPEFDDIFRDDITGDTDSEDEEDEDPEEDNDHDDESQRSDEEGPRGRKRRRFDPERMAARRNIREWKEKRVELLNDYSEYSSYSGPASIYAMKVAAVLSRDTPEVVWWAIVGLTEYFILGRIDRGRYQILVTEMTNTVNRLSHLDTSSSDCVEIGYKTDLYLFLYRHWSMYDSMKYTGTFSTNFKLWHAKGDQRFHEYLVDIGLPLIHCQQQYTSMRLDMRRLARELLTSEEKNEKYDVVDVTFGTFSVKFGFKYEWYALDVYFSLLAYLEYPEFMVGRNMTDRFLKTMENMSLAKKSVEVEHGMQLCKHILIAITEQIRVFIDMSCVSDLQSLLVAQIPDGVPNMPYFIKSSSLNLLAKFTEMAAITSVSNKRWPSLPLLLIVPFEEERSLVIGIPPANYVHARNLFGKAFEILSSQHPETLSFDRLEPNIAILQTAYRARFIESILAMML